MKFKSPLTLRTATCALLLMTALPLLAQTGVNTRRLERDLDIMEGVLDRLLNESDSDFFLDGSTKGFYLNDYGILFHTSQRGRVFAIAGTQYTDAMNLYTRHIEELSEEVENARAVVVDEMKAVEEDMKKEPAKLETIIRAERKSREERAKEREANRQKAISTVKERLTDFFQSYAPSIGQLRSEDRVSVLVKMRHLNYDREHPGYITASVLKSDLDAFRKKQLSEAAFNKKIIFKVNGTDEDISNDIEIMSEIFERALKNESLKSSNNGLYVNGLGALFFMDFSGYHYAAISGRNRNFFITSPDGDAEALEEILIENGETKVLDKAEREKAKKEAEKKQIERAEKIKDTLFSLMADYGHTIRIPEGEKLIVSVKMGTGMVFLTSREGMATPSNMILQLSKSDIEDYNSGSLSAAALKSKMRVTEL